MGYARKGSNPLADSIFFAFLRASNHGGWVGEAGNEVVWVRGHGMVFVSVRYSALGPRGLRAARH